MEINLLTFSLKFLADHYQNLRYKDLIKHIFTNCLLRLFWRGFGSEENVCREIIKLIRSGRCVHHEYKEVSG